MRVRIIAHILDDIAPNDIAHQVIGDADIRRISARQPRFDEMPFRTQRQV